MVTNDEPTTVCRSGPQVLAGLGTFLLTAAAITLVGARWDQFDAGSRLGILIASSVLVYGLTLLLRRAAPFTTRALDVLVAVLVPVDVAAMAVVSGAAWPIVLLAAGPATILAAEVLRRRDPTIVTELGTAIGGILTACGFATEISMPLAGVPVAPLVAGLGFLAAVAAPTSRTRSVGFIWAAAAGLAPGLRLIENLAFTGQGTLRDMGLLDEASTVSLFTTAAISIGALVIIAIRRSSIAAILTTVVVAATTAIDAWARFDPPNSALLLGLSGALVGVELALAFPALRLNKSAVDAITDAVSGVAGVLTFAALATSMAEHLPDGVVPSSDWKYTAAICAVYWIVADLRRAFENGQSGLALYLVGGNWYPALAGLAAAVVAATKLGFTDPLYAGIAAAIMAAVALTTLRPGRLATAWTLAIAGPFLALASWPAAAILGAVGCGTMLMAGRLGRRTPQSLAASQGAVLAFIPLLSGAAALLVEFGVVAAVLYGSATLWLAVTLIADVWCRTAFALRAMAAAALPLMLATSHDWVALALLVMGLAHGLEWWLRGSRRDLAFGAALLAVAGLVAFPWAGGLNWIVAGAMGGCLAVGLVGAATLIDGYVIGSPVRVGVGGWIVGCAWMAGLGISGVEALEPYLYPVLAFVAWELHRARSNPWFVVAPVLGLATIVGFQGRIESGEPWHLLVLGIVAVGVAIWGSVRDQVAARSLGAAVAVAVGGYEALAQSVGLESWGWLVISGASTITIAALLEVSSERSKSDIDV